MRKRASGDGGHEARRLETEQALLSAVVDAIPAGVVVLDTASGEILLANEEARRVLGEPERAAPSPGAGGRRAAGRLDDTPYGDDDWPVLRSLRQGETVADELVELVRDDGSRAVLDVRSSPVAVPSGAPVLVVVVQDVSDREAADRAQREFVTNAAHELLTPLAAITSAVDVLQGGAKDDPEQRDRFLAHAERETHRLGRLARALLVLARAQIGTEAPRAEVVELGPLLDEIVAGLTVAPEVTVVVDCAPDLAFVTHRELLEQALVNVATNAAKFTRSGSILFRARARGDSRVAVEVSDSGPGIPAGEHTAVFDRFYRSPATRGAEEGFGLGLAIARQAVEALGGTIELRPHEGGGTTVALTLPGAHLVRR